ncbi:MAG: hypothetical protein ABIK77_03375 [candidate division WOR-3 bacterium]|uniref:Uncharacterized protein n=1 Tax=candidate division WOR-3 bacterium TaxID=2052148 RepID=A0A7C4VZX6_UNCW3
MKEKIIKKDASISISELEVIVSQISNSYAEISVRCPYCHNLICSFGLRGYSLEVEESAPKIDWQKVIEVCRTEYIKQRFNKMIFDYPFIKTQVSVSEKSKV